MSSLVQLNEGTVFAGDFRVVKPLSAGGMGAVYVVEQVSTGMQRALKLMHPQLVTDPALRRRFEQEARVGSQIDSEHVVQVLAAGVDAPSGMPWLVMELLKGEDLAAYVQRTGCVAPAMVRQIFDQLCHALGAAHTAGIVHRDLKPENIYLAPAKRAGAQFTVKVLDFGIAKIVAEAKKTETAALGSPMWMSPEQTARGHQISPASDVWALGLIAFHLLTGRFYWRAAEDANATLTNLLREIVLDSMAPPTQRAAELGCGGRVPPAFDGWFARCVARDTRARFQHASEANAELQRLLASVPDMPGAGPGNAAFAPTGYAPPMAGTPPFGNTGGGMRPPTPPYGPPPSQALGPTTTPPHMPGQTPVYGAPPVVQAPTAYGAPPPIVGQPTAYAPPAPPQAFVGGPPAHAGDAMYGPGTPVAGSYTNPRPDYGPPMTPAQPAAAPQKSSAGLVIGLIAALLVVGGGITAAVILIPGKSGAGGKNATSGTAATSSTPPSAAPTSSGPSEDITGKLTSIAGGAFQMGSKDEDDEKPVHEVKLAPYEIDTTEVTVTAWKACVAGGACRPDPNTVEFEGASDAEKKSAKYCNASRGDRADHPINCVDWNDATAFCKWAGKRLPTEAEWEYAARAIKSGGVDSRTFPWGKSAPDPMYVNACGTECVALLKREDLLEKDQSTDPLYKSSDEYTLTSPVGSFPKGASDLGLMDMAGNVAEWVEDWYGTYSLNGPPQSGTKHVIRGGSWEQQATRRLRVFGRGKDETGFRDITTGFRCARSKS
jgi:formylglycine-generating enzyme required for sulfatase activity/serine/threonine protein kinase